MVGLRTAVVLGVVVGAVYLVGGAEPARQILSIGDTWMSRLQILMGRPVPLAPEESPRAAAPAPVEPAAAESSQTQPVRVAPRSAEPTVLTLVPIESFEAEFSAVEGANLRRAPRLEATRIDVVGRGQRLQVTGRTLDRRWYRLRHNDQEAFVSAGLVRPESVETSLGTVVLRDVERELDEMAGQLRRARFHEVLSDGRPLRLRLERAARWIPVDSVVIRLELMSATAEIALGQKRAASLSLERALEVDRGLELDPIQSPPKLRRLLAQVRETR